MHRLTGGMNRKEMSETCRWAGREKMFARQKHTTEMSRGGNPTERLKGRDSSVFTAKCWADLNRRRGESRGGWKERLGNSSRGRKAGRRSRLLGNLFSSQGSSKRRGCEDAAEGRESFARGARRDSSTKHSFSSLALGSKLHWILISSVCVYKRVDTHTHTHTFCSLSFQSCRKNNQRHCQLTLSLLPSQRYAPVVPRHIHNKYQGQKKGKKICAVEINKNKVQIKEGLIFSTLWFLGVI